MPGTTGRPRRVWPLAVLVLTLAITLVAAAEAWMGVYRHRRTSEHLLRDYASFAVWTYQHSASTSLGEGAWFALNPILHDPLHENRPVPTSVRIPVYLERSLQSCHCAVPWRAESYFSFTVGADTLDVTGGPIEADFGRWLTDTLNAAARVPGSSRLAVIAATSGPRPAVVAYGLMPTVWADTVLYGFVFDNASLPALFHDALVSTDVLPPAVASGLAADSIVAVRVTTADGVTLYQSDSWPAEALFTAHDSIVPRNGGLRLEATVLPPLANRVFAGDNARSRLLFLLAIVLAAIALTVVAMRQFQRERAFTRRQADFVAAVSHELRTPLAQIRLFLETLRLGRYDGDAERDWLLEHVDRETIRLSHLVSNVLQFSRGSMEHADLAPADVAAEAADVVRGFQPLAESRRVTVRAELDEGAAAPLNRELFRQLLLNLLDNAVKYGPEGQRVEVRVARDNGTVRLSVSDQGPGIPATMRDRIWDPFVRGDDTSARAIGGSGIGLSVVRDAARRHGATLRLEDAAGGGSVFIIDFPAAGPSVS